MPPLPSLPMISYRDLQAKKPAALLALAQTMHEIGFFYLLDHPVPLEKEIALLNVSKDFFALPLVEKEKISIYHSQHFRGFSNLGSEQTQGIPDHKEIIDFGRECNSIPLIKPYHTMVGPNQWPLQPAALQQVVLSYMDIMLSIGATLMESIALSMGWPKTFFQEQFKGQPFSLMRVIYYPHQEANPEKKIGVGEHTDFGCLVLLLQDDTGGLEVQLSSGSWVEAPPIPRTLVVNIGDMLALWSGAYLKATPHRVINKSNKDRYSFPFFYEPAIDTVVQQRCYGEHIYEAFRRSFPDHG